MLAPVRTVAPDAHVSLDEAKRHLVIEPDVSEFNDLITGFIATVTSHLDGWRGILGRAIATQTWRQDFCTFSRKMRLPLGPAASISSVTYFDGSNAQLPLSASVYQLLTDVRGPFLALKPDQSWPGTYARQDAVSVTYVAGEAPDDVPPQIKTAILMHVAHLFEHREAVSSDAMTEMPLGAMALIAPLRRVGV